MRPPPINTLSREEILEIRAASAPRKREERECLWCDKKVLMREGQSFCSATCRAKYAQSAARLTLERLLREKEIWLKEREEFVREIARLKGEGNSP